MHSIQIHKVIALMVSFLFLFGFWHRGDKPTARELRVKLFYSLFYVLFFMSLVVGAVKNEKLEKTIFLAELSIGVAAFAVKLWFLIWKQNEVIELANRICVFSIRNDFDYRIFEAKLRGFMKFVFIYVVAVIVGCSLESVVLPLLGSEKMLFLEIGFPLDWRNSEIAFWIATFFVVGGVFLLFSASLFSILVWYLLFMCSLRYEVLGSEIQRIGQIGDEIGLKLSKKQMHDDFIEGLKSTIQVYVHIRQLADELGSLFSKLFFTQFGTSGLCICGSIYCLAFDVGDNLLERLIFLLLFFYFFAELFMITYFGNEITLASNRLSYSLFESKWYDQPQSTKKCIIIFGEYLKRPQVLVIGKLYPLTVETFTRILNSAYSMFNILKNVKR